MIQYCIPWDSGKNIGECYHDTLYFAHKEWVCFIDADTHPGMNPYFGKHLEEIIEANPEYSMLTCYTNRIGMPYMKAPHVDDQNHDIAYHRRMYNNFRAIYHTDVMDITDDKPLSGVLMLVNVEDYVDTAPTNPFSSGMRGIDNEFHFHMKKHGYKVGMMKGFYLYHWYDTNRSHLKG